MSSWDLKNPTNDPHAKFERLHANASTLFKRTTKVHTAADSPPPGTVEECIISDCTTSAGGGDVYAGYARLHCEINYATALQPQWCHENLIENPIEPRLHWCTKGIPVHDRDTHDYSWREDQLWDESRSCQPLDGPQDTTWRSFFTTEDLVDLADAHERYYNTTDPALRDAALVDAELVFERAIARKVAIAIDPQGMPNATDARNVVDLHDTDVDQFDSPNVDLVEGTVRDALETWTPTLDPRLAAFAPLNLTFETRATALNADKIRLPATVRLTAQPANLTAAPLMVNYGARTYGSAVAHDPDNLNYTGDYLGPQNPLVRDPPILNLTTPDEEPAGLGLGQAAFNVSHVPSQVTACVRQQWTAQANGTDSNLDPPDRLALEPDENRTCKLFPDLNVTHVNVSVPVSVALEFRNGPAGTNYTVRSHVVHDPYEHAVNATAAEQNDTTNRTLPHARTAFQPSPLEAAVEPVGVRVTVTVPTNLSARTKANILGGLLHQYQDDIAVYAVETENLPRTRPLQHALTQVTGDQGTVVLVPAGTLPRHLWDDDPQEKLMTINGLAASREVVTVGAGSRDDGLAPWSRRGPTPDFMPKPDLVAPSPEGTTAGAVAHVRPYAEALAARGLRQPALHKAALGSYALPVSNEAGTPATYYGQGAGAIDQSEFLDLNSTTSLLSDAANRTGLTDLEVRQRYARVLNTSTDTVNQSRPGEIVGLAASPTGQIRAGVGNTLVNLTLDTPALPHTGRVDFGVVNQNRTGQAYFGPINLDPLINATLNSIRLTLRKAGYTGTLLDERMQQIRDIMEASVDPGQEVTLNATHYYFTDLFEDDFLFSVLDQLLQTAQDDHDLPPGATPEDIRNLTAILNTWEATPHHLVHEESGHAKLPVQRDRTCGLVSGRDVLGLGNTVLEILRTEAAQLAPTPKGGEAAAIVGPLPHSARSWIRDEGAFVYSQAQQASCLHDLKEFLGFLENRTESLRQLKNSPLGKWNATEALEGTWNQTPIGRDIAKC